jgi:hypothetical protein
MKAFVLAQLRFQIIAAIVFLTWCSATPLNVHDLSEFACPAGEAVQVVYYEADSLTSLPSESMKNNMHLAYDGECVPQINFPKSTGNFAGSGNEKNFVAYFEGQLQFSAFGAWTLYTTSQDGSILYIEDELVVDNNGLHRDMGEKYGTFDVTDSLIKSFRLEYFKGKKGGNGLIMKWEGPDVDKTILKSNDFYAPESFSFVGLALFRFFVPWVTATRYATTSRKSLPKSFDTLAPVSKDTKYEYVWPMESCDLNDNYAVVLEGDILFPVAGEYIITETSDDDARMYVDDKLVLRVNGHVGVRDIGQASISIPKGGTIKRIRVEFLELCLGNGLDVSFKGPDGTAVQFFNKACENVRCFACSCNYDYDDCCYSPTCSC